MKKKVVGGGGRTRRVEPEPTSRTTPWIIPAAAIATAMVAILSARGLTEDSTLPKRAEVPSTVAPHKGTDPDLPSVVQIRVEETAVPFAYPGGLQRGEGAEGGQQEARKKADTSLLSWLLYPISVVEWEAAHWDGVPLFLRRHPLFYTALNSGLAEVDALLMVQARESATPLLMHPTMPHTQADCSIVKGGMDDLTAEYTSIHHGFLDGGTVVCNLVPAYWQPLAVLMRELSLNAGFNFLSNMYLTPPNSAGFTAHTDNKDGMIMQVAGRKRWRVWEPTPLHQKPLRSQMLGRPHEPVAEKGALVFDAVLSAGDLLYVPRGYVHQAAAGYVEPSLHYTISAAKNLEWSTLLPAMFKGYPRDRLPPYVRKLVDETLGGAVKAESTQPQQSWIRESLPLGYNTLTPPFRTRLRGVLTQLHDVMAVRLAKQLRQQPAGNVAFAAAFDELVNGTNAAMDTAVQSALDSESVFLNYTSNLLANGESVLWPPADALRPSTSVQRVGEFKVTTDASSITVTASTSQPLRVRRSNTVVEALEWIRHRATPFTLHEIGGNIDEFSRACIVRILLHLNVVEILAR